MRSVQINMLIGLISLPSPEIPHDYLYPHRPDHRRQPRPGQKHGLKLAEHGTDVVLTYRSNQAEAEAVVAPSKSSAAARWRYRWMWAKHRWLQGVRRTARAPR
jgi:hypothetical protein